MSQSIQQVSNLDQCVQQIIERVGKRLVVSVPLALGKPNQLVNALYNYAKAHPEIQLKMLTALSLDIPMPKPGLEEKFLSPFLERVFAGYERLDYVKDQRKGDIPDNIEICNFYVKAGEYIGNDYVQQHYISSNYTHVARDLISVHDVNVLIQLIAVEDNGTARRYSLSSNPDVSLDVYNMLKFEPVHEKHQMIVVGQIHYDLPFMGNDAEVSEDFFDIVVDDPALSNTLFSTPNTAVSLTDHMIGMHASMLVKDGGTLQLGIGAMSDAVVNALLLRHKHNGLYRQITDTLFADKKLIRNYGGLEPFDKGLYGSSEMFVNGFRFLIDAGVIKRKVYDDVEAQRRDNRGEPNPDHTPNFFMHGGFFLGPRDFYQWLREMPAEISNAVCMSSINKINQLSFDPPLLRAQRVHARFMNSGFMATLTGAVVSDGLEDGQVVSGVGGQFNFVAMGHQLADARSVLMVRSVREGAVPESSIRFNYGHCTIPRHLRDILITEYGIADLRGRTDSNVIKAMLCIADSRFQPALMQQAKAAGKLDRNYQIPPEFSNNTPQALAEKVKHLDTKTAFPAFPLGTDMTQQELQLTSALKSLKTISADKKLLFKHLIKAWRKPVPESVLPYLKRMSLDEPANFQEKIYAKLLASLLSEKIQG